MDRPASEGTVFEARVSAGGNPPEETPLPREAYALLAQANLLRVRGRWEEAAASCMAALRLAPDSASANSLLGDIFENQGRHEDAVQWYRMALDANPDSPADRLKLDRLLLRDARPPFEAAPTPASEVESPPTGAGGWAGRLRRDPEGALRWAAVAAALAVLLVLAGAFAAAHVGGRGRGGDQEVRSAPVVVPPLAGALPSDPDAAPLRDPGEQAVLAALQASRALSADGIAVYDAQADPRDGRLTVTFGVTSSGAMSRALVARDALRVLQAGASAAPSAGVLTARCLLVAGGSAASLAFVGDAARAVIPAAAPADTGLGDAQVEALFSSAWWSPTANLGA